MESLLRSVVREYPLVAEGTECSRQSYFAISIEQLKSWSRVKRHAAEWQRAFRVRQHILQLLENSGEQTCK